MSVARTRNVQVSPTGWLRRRPSQCITCTESGVRTPATRSRAMVDGRSGRKPPIPCMACMARTLGTGAGSRGRARVRFPCLACMPRDAGAAPHHHPPRDDVHVQRRGPSTWSAKANPRTRRRSPPAEDRHSSGTPFMPGKAGSSIHRLVTMFTSCAGGSGEPTGRSGGGSGNEQQPVRREAQTRREHRHGLTIHGRARQRIHQHRPLARVQIDGEQRCVGSIRTGPHDQRLGSTILLEEPDDIEYGPSVTRRVSPVARSTVRAGVGASS